jgi:hypothetical protein
MQRLLWASGEALQIALRSIGLRQKQKGRVCREKQQQVFYIFFQVQRLRNLPSDSMMQPTRGNA